MFKRKFITVALAASLSGNALATIEVPHGQSFGVGAANAATDENAIDVVDYFVKVYDDASGDEVLSFPGNAAVVDTSSLEESKTYTVKVVSTDGFYQTVSAGVSVTVIDLIAVAKVAWLSFINGEKTNPHDTQGPTFTDWTDLEERGPSYLLSEQAGYTVTNDDIPSYNWPTSDMPINLMTNTFAITDYSFLEPVTRIKSLRADLSKGIAESNFDQITDSDSFLILNNGVAVDAAKINLQRGYSDGVTPELSFNSYNESDFLTKLNSDVCKQWYDGSLNIPTGSFYRSQYGEVLCGAYSNPGQFGVTAEQTWVDFLNEQSSASNWASWPTSGTIYLNTATPYSNHPIYPMPQISPGKANFDGSIWIKDMYPTSSIYNFLEGIRDFPGSIYLKRRSGYCSSGDCGKESELVSLFSGLERAKRISTERSEFRDMSAFANLRFVDAFQISASSLVTDVSDLNIMGGYSPGTTASIVISPSTNITAPMSAEMCDRLRYGRDVKLLSGFYSAPASDGSGTLCNYAVTNLTPSQEWAAFLGHGNPKTYNFVELSDAQAYDPDGVGPYVNNTGEWPISSFPVSSYTGSFKLGGVGTHVNKLSSIGSMKKLRINMSQLSDISGLTYLSNVDYIEITGSKLTSLSSLEGLNFKAADFTGNSLLDDISAINPATLSGGVVQLQLDDKVFSTGLSLSACSMWQNMDLAINGVTKSQHYDPTIYGCSAN